MRAFLTKCHEGLKAFVYRYNELQLAALMVTAWLPVQYLLWWLFPDAAPLSGSVLHKLYLTALVFAFGHGFLWLGMKLNLPVLFGFVENEFTTAFNNLTSWQKCLLFAFFWSVYLLVFAHIWVGASQVA